MDIGLHQDNPHTEPHVGRFQRQLIYAPPVVGSKANFDRELFDMFIGPTILAFEAHKEAVKLSRISRNGNPLRLNRVF